MERSMPPAADVLDRLREAAFGLLLRDHRPIDPAALAEATGIDTAEVEAATTRLAQAGRVDLDPSGRVAGAAGLSLVTGPHRLRLHEASFRTWCAYDALGIAAALRVDAIVETNCGACGTPIRLELRGGRPPSGRPERLWLAEAGADLRSSFCAPTVLLCGDAHGAAWAEAYSGRGRLLDTTEGARIGGNAWAGCAETARRLA